MRKIKYLFLLTAMFICVAVIGKNTGHFNPDSPGEPTDLTLTEPSASEELYVLTLVATEGGSIQSGEGKYEEGTEVTVVAKAAATNFVFTGWTDEEGNILSKNLSYTYTMPARDVTLTANYEFKPDSPSEPDKPDNPNPPTPETLYTLTLVATEGGSIQSGAGKYEEGTEVTVVAKAAATNFVFTGWTDEEGNTLSKSLSFSYTMPARDVTLTANYEFKPDSPSEPDKPDIPDNPPTPETLYTLTLVATEGGSIQSGTGEYKEGTEVTVVAKAAATNFVFTGWTDEEGNTLSQSLSFSYTMPARDVTLTANYEFKPDSPSEPNKPDIPDNPDPQPDPVKHTLTIIGGEGGSISVNGTAVSTTASFDIEEEASVNISVTLATNFVFNGWFSEDTLYSSVKDLAFKMGTQDMVLTAMFSYNPDSPSEPSHPTTQQNELYLMSVVGLPGETINYPVYLNSNDSIKGVSFEIQFPSKMVPDFENALISNNAIGFTFTHSRVDMGGYLGAKPNAVTRNNEGIIEPGDFAVYRINMTGNVIPPGNTPLLIVPLTIGSDIEKERYRIWLSQVTLTLYDGTTVGATVRNGAVNTDYVEPDSYAYLDNLIGTGNQAWELTQEMQISNPITDSYKCDLTEIAKLLVCSDPSFMTFKGLSDVGKVSDQLTAGNGYWFNHTGYVCSATDADRAFCVRYDEAASQLTLTQAPNAFHGAEEINTKVYFTYKYKYYEIAINLKVTDIAKKFYNITYYVDGELYHRETVEEGAKIPVIDDPVKTGHTFVEWSGLPADMIMPGHDLSVSAQWEADAFAFGNVMYNITSRTNRTVEVTGVSDNAITELTVPAEVEYVGITYSVTTVASNAFANCPNLLEVTFEGVMNIPADVFGNDAVERNLFVYAPAGSTSEYKGNVVIGGVAENVILHDAKPLRLSREFTANKVSYSREFYKQTYPGEAGGWETIVLPFDVKQIVSEKGDVLTPFRSGVEDSKHFWLAGLTSNGFGRASTISANIPYIICMPNSPEYYDDYNITGVVTFSAENATMHKTMDATTYTGNAFKLVPAYEGADASASVYAINDADVFGHHAGALFVSNSRAVRPFEAYATGIGGGAKPMFFTIGSEDATGITDINMSADTHNMMYDLSGRRVNSQQKGIVIMRNANGKYSKKYNK